MSDRPRLDKLLKNQTLQSDYNDFQSLLSYAESIVKIENVIAVVSDIKNNTSNIFAGKFGAILGIENYRHEHSIWEKTILNLMPESEREEKYLAELRFFHFLRRVPRHVKADFYMASKLRIKTLKGEYINILHRMYYVYSPDSGSIRFAVCLYGCLALDFVGKSVVVNSITGTFEELTSAKDISILSKRELQILKLIDFGKKSAEIAELLSISKNTVSRHRQEILAKLQVKNSIEACKIARTIGII